MNAKQTNKDKICVQFVCLFLSFLCCSYEKLSTEMLLQ